MSNPDDPYLKKAEAYVFKTKEEWTETKNKVDLWEEKRSGYTIPGSRSRNTNAFEKYAKAAGADKLFDGSGNIKRYREWVSQEFVKDIAPLEGVWTEFYVPGEKKAKFIDLMAPKIVGKKGWLGEEEISATPENKETAAEVAVVKEVNASLSPEREKELAKKLELSDFGDAKTKGQFVAREANEKLIELEKERSRNLDAGRNGTDSDKFKTLQQEYDELIQLREKIRKEESVTVDLPSPKITEQKEEQIKQSIDQGKKEEDQKQEQKEEKRQQAIATGSSAEPEECPCGAKLSDEQKSAINWGRDNPVFQNPVASQINNAQGGFADTLLKINSATALLGTISGAPTGELSKLANSVGNMQGALSSMSNTSNRLSGLPFTGGGPDLLSLVSTVGAAVNFQCALGVEGLDVGAKVGLVTENGKLKLNVAINAQANLSKIMDGIAANLPGDTGASDALQKAKDAIAGAQAELAKITNELNAIAGDINGAIAEVNGLFNDALDFVTQFTNINFALNFSNDPCTKFGVGFQQGILNPEFVERARAANPLNKAVNPGFGTSTR